MIEFHELALSEARNAQAWYFERSRRAADSFQAQLRASIARIEQSPAQFAQIRNRYQYARIVGFPYIVVFRPKQDGTLLVVAIVHTSRKSEYWLKRD